MQISFDLISDLHVDSWPDFDWTYQATSPFCVVAGDVALDRSLLKKTLKHLGEHYKAVFYIDGNEEHRYGLENLSLSYKSLSEELDDMKNVVFLYNQVVILDGVAFLAANCWTTFNWDTRFDIEDVCQGVQDHYGISDVGTNNIEHMAISDAMYLQDNIKKLQKHQDVKSIVIVSHFVPMGEFIEHDAHLNSTYRLNASINSYARQALIEDTEGKVKHWCFGHYHFAVDETVDGVRYVCNPRGRTNTPWYRDPYFPVRIDL